MEKLLIGRHHDITFKRNGEISLCKRLTDELGVTVGDKVNFLTKDNEFLICEAAWGARLRKANKGGGYLRCNSKAVAAMVIPEGEECVAFRTGDKVIIESYTGKTGICILTRQPICIRKKE